MIDELPILETPCRDCNGKGSYRANGQTYDCSACDGSGMVPTAAGELVLRLIRNNLRLDAVPTTGR